MRVVQSLQRGLAVLDFIAERGEPVRTSEIAARFNIDKANASRLLTTLTEAGYTERSDDRRYALANKMRGDDGRQLEGLIALRERTRSLLEGLVEASGECAHMAVLVGDKVWYIDKISSPHALRVDHPVGALAPLHCTALGKAFLAFLPRAAAGAALVRYTAGTIVDAEMLTADLATTRLQGYATDNEEFSPGVRCVAAPLRDAGGRMVAAVGSPARRRASTSIGWPTSAGWCATAPANCSRPRRPEPWRRSITFASASSAPGASPISTPSNTGRTPAPRSSPSPTSIAIWPRRGRGVGASRRRAFIQTTARCSTTPMSTRWKSCCRIICMRKRRLLPWTPTSTSRCRNR